MTEQQEPFLGYATTLELLEEVAARMNFTQNSIKGRELADFCLQATVNLDRHILDYRPVGNTQHRADADPDAQSAQIVIVDSLSALGSVLVDKHVIGGLTENAKRWKNRASSERRKRQKWRKRALRAEAEMKELAKQADTLYEALRLTREYVGPSMLPAKRGWEWFDAMTAYEDFVDGVS